MCIIFCSLTLLCNLHKKLKFYRNAYLNIKDDDVLLWTGYHRGQSVQETFVERGEKMPPRDVIQSNGDRVEEHRFGDQIDGEEAPGDCLVDAIRDGHLEERPSGHVGVERGRQAQLAAGLIQQQQIGLVPRDESVAQLVGHIGVVGGHSADHLTQWKVAPVVVEDDGEITQQRSMVVHVW